MYSPQKTYLYEARPYVGLDHFLEPGSGGVFQVTRGPLVAITENRALMVTPTEWNIRIIISPTAISVSQDTFGA